MGSSKNVKLFPDELTWGPPTLTKEKLERQLKNRLQPWNNEIVILPVRKPHDPLQTLYLIEVPKSDQSPHMASYRFYYRSNTESEPMEYWQVAELFKRNWIQRSNIVTNIYGPLYNEISKLLLRKKQFVSFSISQYQQIIASHQYLFDATDARLQKKLKSFYAKLQQLNDGINSVQRRINAITKRCISEKAGISDPKPTTLSIFIEADWDDITLNLNHFLIWGISLEQYIQDDHYGWRPNKITYKFRDEHSDVRSLTEKEFHTFYKACEASVESDQQIESMRRLENELQIMAKELVQEIKQLL